MGTTTLMILVTLYQFLVFAEGSFGLTCVAAQLLVLQSHRASMRDDDVASLPWPGELLHHISSLLLTPVLNQPVKIGAHFA